MDTGGFQDGPVLGDDVGSLQPAGDLMVNSLRKTLWLAAHLAPQDCFDKIDPHALLSISSPFSACGITIAALL